MSHIYYLNDILLEYDVSVCITTGKTNNHTHATKAYSPRPNQTTLTLFYMQTGIELKLTTVRFFNSGRELIVLVILHSAKFSIEFYC